MNFYMPGEKASKFYRKFPFLTFENYTLTLLDSSEKKLKNN